MSIYIKWTTFHFLLTVPIVIFQPVQIVNVIPPPEPAKRHVEEKNKVIDVDEYKEDDFATNIQNAIANALKREGVGTYFLGFLE